MQVGYIFHTIFYIYFDDDLSGRNQFFGAICMIFCDIFFAFNKNLPHHILCVDK